MSCVLATPSTPDLRLETIAARLRVHDWVQDARVLAREGADRGGGAGSLCVRVVPSSEGQRILRRKGKAHMVTAWERDLQDSGLAVAARVEWCLDEALVKAGSSTAPLATWPDWMPVVSALEVDRGARTLTCRLLVPYDLAIFRGHFPSTPIVPGVLQVGWAVELARTQGLADGRCRGIITVKFRRIVQPGMCLGARVECGPQDGQLQFKYEMDGAVITTGRLQVGDGRG